MLRLATEFAIENGESMFATIRRLGIALAFALTTPAWAVTLPVGNAPAADLLINFDLSALEAPGFFAAVHYNLSMGPLPPASGQFVVDVFGDLNGMNLLSSSFASATQPLVDADLLVAPVLDGLFSLGLRTTPGSTAVFGSAAAFAIRIVCDNAIPPSCHPEQTRFVDGQIVLPSSVPEPATLVLLGLGLVGIVASRRRTLN
jgi:hypothetical protein